MFGAICGSSLATAATMGQVAMPEMRRYGYAGGHATAALAAGGTLGILIPPSIPLIVYCILAEQNIAKLFFAAFLPGRSEEHTSELQSLMRISYAVFCLKKKKTTNRYKLNDEYQTTSK